MWLVTNEEETVYAAAERRDRGSTREVYDESRVLFLHDSYAAYTNAFAQQNHLYCWAHLLRFTPHETILEPADTPAACVREDLMRINQLDRELEASGSQDARIRLQAELDQVFAVTSDHASIQSIQVRLRVQYDGLIRALLCTPDRTNDSRPARSVR